MRKYLFVFVFCFAPFLVTHAQKTTQKNITKASKLGNAKQLSNTKALNRGRFNKSKLAINNSQLADRKANRAARAQNQMAALKSEFADLEQQENIMIHYITTYKVAFPTNTYPLAEAPVTIIELMDKDKNTVSILNFYGAGAKALTDTRVALEKDENDQEKPLALSYSIDMLTNILDFLDRSRKKVVIYDKEEQIAHLSSGVLR